MDGTGTVTRQAAWSAYRAARAAALRARAEEHRASMAERAACAATHRASAAEELAFECYSAAIGDAEREGWSRGRRSWYLEAAQESDESVRVYAEHVALYERMAEATEASS